MARRPRIHVPDGWYHVMSRGNGGEALYRTDEDRRRFLGLVAELPERFGTEIHAFVLMDNHFHLLVRCRRTSLSETMRWLQTAYAVRFNWAHRRRGHVFQGRFKAVLIQEESALGPVARYLHLNPVRVGGLGLSKEDQRRARVVGCPDPGGELVARRLAVLREHAWSSWRVYGGMDPAPGWLSCERIGAGCGGLRAKDQRAALIQYTEEPIRQGHLESPWEGMVAGLVLGEAEDALELIRQVDHNPEAQAEVVRAAAVAARPGWEEIVGWAEAILGRKWEEMNGRHGDWGRDATLAVAVRHLGWGLSEAAARVPGMRYTTAAQAVRRFWRRAERDEEVGAFVRRLRGKCQ